MGWDISNAQRWSAKHGQPGNGTCYSKDIRPTAYDTVRWPLRLLRARVPWFRIARSAGPADSMPGSAGLPPSLASAQPQSAVPVISILLALWCGPSAWTSLTTPRGFPCFVRFPCVHAVATTPAQRLGVLLRSLRPVVSAFPDMAVGSACASSGFAALPSSLARSHETA
jgi:hypothetical protein